MYYLNQKIENLVRIFDQNERKSYLRLDLNENPGGLPEEFVNGVLFILFCQGAAYFCFNTKIKRKRVSAN